MITKKCNCGTEFLENIDITPVRSNNRILFTRCSKCGLVVATHGYLQKTRNQTLLNILLKKITYIKSAIFQ